VVQNPGLKVVEKTPLRVETLSFEEAEACRQEGTCPAEVNHTIRTLLGLTQRGRTAATRALGPRLVPVACSDIMDSMGGRPLAGRPKKCIEGKGVDVRSLAA
jgi:hypothetical protein